MADARELLIKLTVDAAQADRRLKEIAKSTDGLDKSLKSAGSAMKGFIGAAAGAATIGVLVSAFRNAANAMDDMSKASQKVGVSVETLSALGYAAKQSGVSFEGLQTGLKKLNQNLADVENGTTGAAKALRALGVKGADSPEQAMGKIADAFASIPDGAQKTALAMEIFGKAGADMIPMLNAGEAGLDKMQKRAKQLGVVISTETAKQAELFNDSLDDMGLALNSITKNVVAGALPGMSGLAAAMVDGAQASDSWKTLGRGLAEVLGFVAGVAVKTTATFQGFGTMIVGLGKSLKLAASGEFEAAGKAFTKMVDDVNGIENSTNQRLAKMREAFAGIGQTAEPLKTAAGSAERAAAAIKTLGSGTETAAKQLEEFKKLTQTLNEELAKLVSGGDGSLTKLDEINAKIASGTLKLTAAQAEQVRGIAKLIDAQKRLNDENKRFNDLKAEAWSYVDKSEADAAQKRSDTIVGETADLNALEESIKNQIYPLREMGKELQRLDELRQRLRLTDEEWAKAVNLTTKKYMPEQKDMIDKLKDAIDGYAKDMAGAFVSSIAAGENFKETFKNITASFLQNIAQMILQVEVIEPMLKSLKASMNATGAAGGGGFWSSVLGGLSGLFGSAHGNAFAGATGLPHGVYNQPTFFNMPGNGPLQKFARGGVLGEAGPEAILPLRRGAGGKLGVDAAPVNVNVINNAGVNVGVEKDGNDINITIERVRNALTRDIRSGGNAFAGALQNTYGLNRANA